MAKSRGIPCRSFWLQTDPELSAHLNVLRSLKKVGGTPRVPTIAYRMFNSKFQEPSVHEGFSEVVVVKFVPVFESDEEKKAFYQFTYTSS
jgi:bifunctional polynucleotide phosphatase/kinase